MTANEHVKLRKVLYLTITTGNTGEFKLAGNTFTRLYLQEVNVAPEDLHVRVSMVVLFRAIIKLVFPVAFLPLGKINERAKPFGNVLLCLVLSIEKSLVFPFTFTRSFIIGRFIGSTCKSIGENQASSCISEIQMKMLTDIAREKVGLQMRISDVHNVHSALSSGLKFI